jgi:hypothetical protein
MIRAYLIFNARYCVTVATMWIFWDAHAYLSGRFSWSARECTRSKNVLPSLSRVWEFLEKTFCVKEKSVSFHRIGIEAQIFNRARRFNGWIERESGHPITGRAREYRLQDGMLVDRYYDSVENDVTRYHVLQFYGCFWHRCPTCFRINDRELLHHSMIKIEPLNPRDAFGGRTKNIA